MRQTRPTSVRTRAAVAVDGCGDSPPVCERVAGSVAYERPRSRAVWRSRFWAMRKHRAPNTPNLRPDSRRRGRRMGVATARPSASVWQHRIARPSPESGGLALQRLEDVQPQSAKHTQRTMWPRTSNLRLDWLEVRKYEAQRPRERGASWTAVTSLGAAPLSQAGRQGKAGENATPRESAAAFAGQLECCGRIPRYTQRKRCRRCRLAPCISVTAVHDAGALAWARVLLAARFGFLRHGYGVRR